MPGFYDELKTHRPAQVQDLWPSSPDTWLKEKEGPSHFPLCTLAQNLNVWATDEELHTLLTNRESDLVRLSLLFSQAAEGILETIDTLQKHDPKVKYKMIVSSCQGCNSKFHCDNDDIFPVVDLKGDEDFHFDLHVLMCTLNVIHHLLIRDDCTSLVEKLTTMTRRISGESYIMLLVRLMKIRCLPKVGLVASSVFSLVVARCPAKCFVKVEDKEEFIQICTVRLEYVFHAIIKKDSFLLERHWGIMEFINVQPILYYLGMWKGVAHALTESLAGLIASICVALVRIIKEDQGMTYVNDCKSFWDPLFENENDNEIHEHTTPDDDDMQLHRMLLSSNQATFAIAGGIEILAFWSQKGILEQAKVVTRTMDLDPISKYFHVNEDEIHKVVIDPILQDPFMKDFEYLTPLLNSLANGSIPALPEKGLFRKPFESYKKCGLSSCRMKTKADKSGPLMACSGGCGGMERYCCPEHQKEHWKVHKVFCKSAHLKS